MQFAFGQLQAVGLVMAEDLKQHPERLRLYATAIARLADYVLPDVPAEQSDMRH